MYKRQLGEKAREAIIDAVGLSFIPLYRVLGPLSMTVILVLFVWSLLRVLVTIAMRAYAIHRAKGVGMWLLGACWSLPFQLLMSPFRWASEAAEDECQPASEACLPDVEDRAEDIADRVGTETECQAAREEARKGYPASDLEDMERGSRSYPPYVPSFRVSATGGDKGGGQ